MSATTVDDARAAEAEAAANKIAAFDAELSRSSNNIGEVRGVAATAIDTLGAMDRMIEKIDSLASQTRSFADDIDKLQLVFKIMEKAPPLKNAARIGSDMLKAVESTVDKIAGNIDKLARKIEDSGVYEKVDEATALFRSLDAELADAQGQIDETQAAFAEVSDITGKAYTFADEPVLALGALVEIPLSLVAEVNGAYDAAKAQVNDFLEPLPEGDFNFIIEVEQTFGKVTEALAFLRGPLQAVYSVIKPIEPLLGAVDLIASVTVDPVIDFVLDTLRIDEVINAVADKITEPLDEIKDFEFGDIFGAIDFLNGFDFASSKYDHDRDEKIISTDWDTDPTQTEAGDDPTPRQNDPFGIGQFANDVKNKLTGVVDAVEGEADAFVRRLVGELNADGGGVAMEIISDQIENFRNRAEDGDGDDNLSASIASPIPDNPRIAIHDVILIGDDNDNIITSYGGLNLLYGGIGDDTLIGDGNTLTPLGTAAVPGDNVEVVDDAADPDDGHEDIAVFTGPLIQYRFEREMVDGVEHVEMRQVSPIEGSSFDGTDTLIGIEKVIFLGDSDALGNEYLMLTIDELFDKVTFVDDSASTFNGSAGTDEQYIFGRATEGTTIFGGEGNDLLAGGTGNDYLIGNDGDDLLRGNGGTDDIRGGAGNDTVVARVTATDVIIDLADGGPPGWTGYDGSIEDRRGGQPSVFSSLISVENAQASIANQGARDFVRIYGDDGANLLRGSARIDAPLGGDPISTGIDVLVGRGGDDTLIGNSGDDLLSGGTGVDFLEGGAGDDTLVDDDDGSAGGNLYDGGDGDDTVIYGTDLRGSGASTPTQSAVRAWEGVLAKNPDLKAELQEAGQAPVITRAALSESIVLLSEGAIDEDGHVTRLVERYVDGVLVGTDVLVDVETVVGSDAGDVLHGGTGRASMRGLVGGKGDDIIRIEEARGLVDTGTGSDIVHIGLRLASEDAVIGTWRGNAQYEKAKILGDGEDTLDLSEQDGVRWTVSRQGRNGDINVIAVDERYSGDVDANGTLLDDPADPEVNQYIAASARGFGTIIGGDGDDYLANPYAHTVRGGGGNDFLRGEGAFVGTLDGGTGDDEIDLEGSGTALGGAGNDIIDVLGAAFPQVGPDNDGIVTVYGGTGDDIVTFKDGVGGASHISGDAVSGGDDGGLDIITGQYNNSIVFRGNIIRDQSEARVVIDLDAGTITNNDDPASIDATISGFEIAIGTDDFGDVLSGARRSETAIPGDLSDDDPSNDVRTLVSGNDQLIGGGGDDTLEGLSGLSANEATATRGQFLNVDGDFADDLAGSWTVEAWISTVDGDDQYNRVVTAPSGNGAQTFSLLVRNGVTHVRFDGPNVIQEGGPRIDDGERHHLAARFDGDTGTLTTFVDGVEVMRTEGIVGTPLTANGNITIGAYNEAYGQNFDGDIDGVRVTSGPLTNAEIVAAAARDDDGAIAAPTPGAPSSAFLYVLGQRATEYGPLLGRGVTAVDHAAAEHVVTRAGVASGDDVLYGGAGTDELYGGDGDDLLHGGNIPETSEVSGVDYLHGGLGRDTASFALSAPGTDATQPEVVSTERFAAIDVDLETGLARRIGSDLIEAHLVSIENVIGTLLDDEIHGDALGNALHGGLGADTVHGRGGDDVITVLGDDIADGGAGDDIFVVGAGNAAIAGGSGENTIAFDGSVFFRYNVAEQRYLGETIVTRAAWATAQTDADGNIISAAGSADERTITRTTSDGTETQTWTPGRILAIDPVFATDIEDAGAIVFDEAGFDIVLSEERETFEGTFEDIDAFETGETRNSYKTDNFTGTGTSGDDVLHGDFGGDVMRGLAGADRLFGHGGDDDLVGQAGDDTLSGSDDNDRLVGGAGWDFIQGGRGDDVAAGGRDDDSIFGAAGNDDLKGGGGNDLINGGAGEDHLKGSAGDDTVNGDSGSDVIVAGSGFDLIDGGDGDDSINGGGANDTLNGGQGKDRIVGANGRDTLSGDGGDDLLNGGQGLDRLFGGDGEDTLKGDDGRDFIYGEGDDDRIFGDAGNDVLNGGVGNDLLFGDNGNDALTGGTGADVFVARGAFGFDQIFDFEDTAGDEPVADGLDLIDLRALRALNGGKVSLDQLSLVQREDRVRITLDLDRDGITDTIDLDGDGTADPHRIDVLNATAAHFQDADFIF
ncbi:LamG-like jellyroll fold domain-containing protein [Acuticoccus sp. MNP-M23]|uniref:LamG-like jellyroll fold domain-containing protein n=1 Tax=Acuticoccus sp. MNP-M23 TaxID=3072793 RepID=UPI00281655F4|nr:LamG-like jellyroll fold domain-containing protein [Acuticoccus sp. MNP-M23]WMS42780.1 LamG-like jellyroll fold domain-containing protein [Acuticoccus sp. MNP-M23]